MQTSSSSAHVVAFPTPAAAVTVSFADVRGKRFVRVSDGAMRSYFEVDAQANGDLANVTDRELIGDIDEAASAPVTV